MTTPALCWLVGLNTDFAPRNYFAFICWFESWFGPKEALALTESDLHTKYKTFKLWIFKKLYSPKYKFIHPNWLRYYKQKQKYLSYFTANFWLMTNLLDASLISFKCWKWKNKLHHFHWAFTTGNASTKTTS